MKIAVGNSRMDKKWKNIDISWEDFCSRVSTTIRTTETVEEYHKLKKGQQDAIKDVGGYVAGNLREGSRKKGFVLCRSMIVLDMDYATPGIWDELVMLHDFRCCAYSTHKHTPEHPRIRLAIPLTREISEVEYPAVARILAKDIGIDLFDDTTYEAHRLMYWPSTSSNGEYFFREHDGDLLDPDIYLSRYDNWKDESTWPRSSRQSEVARNAATEAADPLTKPGIIGAFNRAYTIEDAIDTFLSYIYEPSAMNGRYDYIPADSSAGVVIYDGKFAYSHHATDPVCGKLVSAFDLVRLHKFKSFDDKCTDDIPVNKLPSYKAMTELAANDSRVKLLLAEERRTQAAADFTEDTDWEKNLEYEPRSTVLKNSLSNLLLILKNDPKLQGIRYNRLANQIYGEDLPWDRPNSPWRDADMAQLVAYIDKRYGAFTARNYELALTKTADDRAYHPIKEYLDSLPEWDRIPRIDTLLINFLGAEDSPYTRAVTRKTLVAAVARILKPGTKHDSILVLSGKQGIGKSTLFAKLGGKWYSDSLSISDMKDKTAAEKLQGYWILEMGELAGIKKMDVETVKSFITRVDDKYRPSYGRTVESHPRQCVIVGTTNSDSGFLRDITGNRRFWPVRVVDNSPHHAWELDNIDQIWAEALVSYADGEELYLKGKIAAEAYVEQCAAMENDDREGLVAEYLDTLLPLNWDTIDINRRQEYFRFPDDPTRLNGSIRRKQVCIMEIWCECFGKSRESIKKSDSYEIEGILTQLGGWAKYDGNKTGKKAVAMYGVQRVFIRA